MDGRKTKVRVTIEGTNQLRELLLDPTITRDIANAKDALERVLSQLQRDVLELNKDREDAWAQVLGIQKIWGQVLLFAKEGEFDIEVQREEVRKQEQLLKQNQ